jgi:hypothetical protein
MARVCRSPASLGRKRPAVQVSAPTIQPSVKSMPDSIWIGQQIALPDAYDRPPGAPQHGAYAQVPSAIPLELGDPIVVVRRGRFAAVLPRAPVPEVAVEKHNRAVFVVHEVWTADEVGRLLPKRSRARLEQRRKPVFGTGPRAPHGAHRRGALGLSDSIWHRRSALVTGRVALPFFADHARVALHESANGYRQELHVLYPKRAGVSQGLQVRDDDRSQLAL